MTNGRWLSRELIHLDSHMEMLHTDIRSNNWKSAETNWALAMGIIQGMERREKKSSRSMDKMGVVVKFFYGKVKPFLREVAKDAIKEYLQEQRRGIKYGNI